MGIFDRIARLMKSNINDVIEKAEDPEKMLKQILEELNNDLLAVKTQVAQAIATEKQLAIKAKQYQEEADKWQAKAELAVQKGDDDLAREALARKKTNQANAEGFQAQWAEAKKSVVALKDSLAKLESKIAEAQTKKDLLIARHRNADAGKKIQQTLSRTGSSGAMQAFDRMEQKVLESETQAAAYGELADSSIEGRFAQLEAGHSASAVEDELAAMKAKMLPPSDPQRQLPPGSSPS